MCNAMNGLYLYQAALVFFLVIISRCRFLNFDPSITRDLECILAEKHVYSEDAMRQGFCRRCVLGALCPYVHVHVHVAGTLSIHLWQFCAETILLFILAVSITVEPPLYWHHWDPTKLSLISTRCMRTRGNYGSFFCLFVKLPLYCPRKTCIQQSKLTSQFCAELQSFSIKEFC
jgi:hypothetical protein